MKRHVSAVDARKRLGEILESVYYRGDEVIIERAGKPMAVVIPAQQYERLQRDRNRIIELIEMNWEHTKDVPYEEIEKAIEEATAEVGGKRRVS
jgi:prevent-host-death family protein